MGWFDDEGAEKKKPFRVYCNHEGCKRFVMGKWGGGGYGSIMTKFGPFDARNQVWLCGKHSDKPFKKEGISTEVQEHFQERVRIKRELRRLGVPFFKDDSLKVLREKLKGKGYMAFSGDD